MIVIMKADSDTMVFPIVPNNIQINHPSPASSYNTVKGEIYRAGNIGSRSISWASIFPVNKNYSFVHPQSERNGRKYVAFINKYRSLKKDIRFIMYDENMTCLANFLCMIDDFSYSFDVVGDIKYSISIKEKKVLK